MRGVFVALLIADVLVSFAASAILGAGIGGIVTIGFAVLSFALLVPFMGIAWIAYPTAVLERTGAWRAMRLAKARSLGVSRRRACLLGGALLVATLGPCAAIEFGLDQVAALTHLWALKELDPPLQAVFTTALSLALATSAAIDYRNRREGVDLHAAIDAAATATATA